MDSETKSPDQIEHSPPEPPSNSSVTAPSSTEKDGFSASVHLENGNSGNISEEHRRYLIERHGSLELEPLPSMDDGDPLNWPSWKKNTNLFLVSFHALMTTFTAAAIIPAFRDLSIDLKVSITGASYLTSIQILILGVSPLFWKPISNTYGRRPIWLISTLGSMVCNIGCSESKTYASQIITRILVAFFISPAIGISSAVVTETFFKAQRGFKMGIWTVMVTLGPPTGPFLMGFVAYHTGNWQWIYRILAITNFVQFIAYFFLSPETLYFRRPSATNDIASAPPNNPPTHSPRSITVSWKQISPTKLRAMDFLEPFGLFGYLNVVIPTVAYSLVFGFSSVLLTVEIPQLFTPAFHFNAQQIGLQFIGMIVGSILGEQIGGRGSDFIMRPSSGPKNPEHRIYLAYPGFLCALVGLVVFCIQTDHTAAAGKYNVTPIIGIAIAAFGNQVITTVLTTYCIDCHPERSGSVGVFINLVRSTWGFIGPFWFPDMFENIGLKGSAGLMVGILVVFSVMPTIWLQWRGEKLR